MGVSPTSATVRVEDGAFALDDRTKRRRFVDRARSVRRLVFPPVKLVEPEGEANTSLVLVLIAILSILGPVREMLLWGPAQGCAYVFAGVGVGCG